MDSRPGPRSLLLIAELVVAHHHHSTMILNDDQAFYRSQHSADPAPNLITIITALF